MSRSVTIRLLVIALVVALFASACGDDGADTSSEDSADEEVTGADADDETESSVDITTDLDLEDVIVQLATGTGNLSEAQVDAVQNAARAGATCSGAATDRASPRVSQVEVEVVTVLDGCLRYSYEVANFRTLVDDIREIRNGENVIAVSPMLLDYHLNQDSDEILAAETEWLLDSIDSSPLFESDAPTGEGIVVAIVDSGIETSYPGIDPERVTRVPDSGTGDYVSSGHGTIAAAIVVAPLGDATRALSPGVQLLDVPADLCEPNACGCDPCAPMTAAEAIRWSTDNGADIISMSFGYQPSPRPAWWTALIDQDELQSASETIEVALAYAAASGVTMTAAAGNCARGADSRCEFANQFEVPAGFDDVIGVAATERNEDGEVVRAAYSTRQTYVDLAAPGTVAVLGADGVPTTKIGTSYATPFVAAAMAVLVGDDGPLAGRPDAHAVAREILFDAASDLAPAGKDPEFGHGQLQIAAALQEARSWAANNPYVPPTPGPASTDDSDAEADFADEESDS